VGELRCSGRVGSSSYTSDICRVNLVTNPIISREWGKNREVFTTSGTYPWSFVTQIFQNGQPSHGGGRKTFEVMILPKGTLCSVASLLAATLYQGNHDRNHKVWNIVSSERYILHIRVPWNEKFETLTLGGQIRIWYATHLLIVVNNHAKFHPSTIE
jgi:hypothetical protein